VTPPPWLPGLFDRGWALLPIRAGQKAPADALGWTKRTYTLEDFTPSDGVGVKCGKPSNWLVDTDCDCPEAVVAASELLPETGLVHGRASRRRSHYWFVVANAETKKFTDLDSSQMLIEVRSTGAQTVIPPSIHPSGEPIEWEHDGTPLTMDLADYMRAVHMTAIATLFGRHWPSGARHEFAGHLAGFLCRLGFSATETAKIVGTAAKAGKDEESADRERIARDTARKHEEGTRTTGAPKIIDALPEGKALVAKVYSWLGRKGDERLDALNRRHFVAQLGTKAVVGTDDDDEAGVEFQTFDEFKQVYYAERVTWTGKKGKESSVRLGEWWLSNPAQRRYRKVVFKPPPLVAHPDDYNLWKGFAVQPDPNPKPWERCKRFLDHLANVICAGNPEYYSYLLDVLAITVQQPGRPSGVAVVFRGDQGSGKSIIVKLFGALFGKHFAHLSSGDSLTGSFNGYLSGKVVVFSDEAIWGGEKKAAGELKRLVTETTIYVNRKHLNQVEEPNCIHLFLAANEDWVWPVSLKERRGFILDVNLQAYQDAEYFNEIVTEWEDGGAAAFLAYCQQREIPGGRLGPIPKTGALADQFTLSMSSVQQWWLEKLTSGEFYIGKGWPEFISSTTVFEDYLRTSKDLPSTSKKKTESQILHELRRYLPSDLTVARRACEVNVARYGEPARFQKEQRTGWLLPTLALCRREFDRRTGIPREWPEPLSENTDNPHLPTLSPHEAALARERSA
jgi:hypothetical protein